MAQSTYLFVRSTHVFMLPGSNFFLSQVTIVPLPFNLFLETRIKKLHYDSFQFCDVLVFVDARQNVQQFILGRRNPNTLFHIPKLFCKGTNK